MQRPLRNSRRPHSALRQAFSLIELMVVMLIVALLVGMLLAAVRGAMNTARVAAVTVEFKNLEKAITDFKAKYGADPPSGIVLFESYAGWSGSTPSTAAVNRSRALIRQIWPDFDFLNKDSMGNPRDRDINNDGDFGDVIVLNGAECLAFFLGGVPTKSGGEWSLKGFSQNGDNPLQLAGARSGPFYEFDPGRLTDLDGDNVPEYLDSLPGQRNPILFASSYGGRGYRDSDVQLSGQAGYDRYETDRSSFAWYYRRYTNGTPPTVADFNSAPAFNPKSFQLISPGFDGEYGLGGTLDGNMEMTEIIKKQSTPAPWVFPDYDNSKRLFERDNITNFKGGTLN